MTLNLYYTEAALKVDGYEQHLRETQEGFITTNNQDMHSARITQIGMNSRLLEPGRFAPLERTTWEVDKYVIRKVAGDQLA